MTDTLQTIVCKTESGKLYDVHWLRDNRHGCLHIDINPTYRDDRHIIAELVAIHHLIITRAISGTNRFGKDLTLIVSSGAIKKLCLGKSSKPHLNAWGQTLKLRLRDAVIMVNKEDGWIQHPADVDESLYIKTPPVETFPMHGVGHVTLTEHVLEQFWQRNNNKNFRNAMKQLLKELADTALKPATRSKKSNLNTTLKHMGHGHIRYFYNTRTFRQFVVDMRPDRIPTVVTAYNQKPGRTILCDDAKRIHA